MSENDGVFEPPGEAPIRRSVMGTGAQRQYPTEVGAPRLPVTAQHTVTPPTAAAAGGSPPASRRTWFVYAGGAFVVALGLIVGAALLLRDGGGTAAPDASNGPGSDVRPTYEPVPEPTWNATPLAGVALPPLRDPVHADEPTARVMEERIWDYVGPGWTLAINRNTFQVEPRDANAFQALYLVSPEGEDFFLYKLRTDYWLGIIHWDPVERVAWVTRNVGDSWQTVELDLVPGETTETWVSESNVPRTVANVAYLATTDDGTDVFAALDYQYNPEALMTRPPGGPATMLGAFTDVSIADSTERYVAIWVEPATTVAYFRVDTTTDYWMTVTSTWYTHDLATDTLTPMAATPQQPPPGRCWSPGTLIDGYLVVDCAEEEGQDYWLIDPTGAEPALQYTGAVPPSPRTSVWVDATELGLLWDDGWAELLRALP